MKTESFRALTAKDTIKIKTCHNPAKNRRLYYSTFQPNDHCAV